MNFKSLDDDYDYFFFLIFSIMMTLLAEIKTKKIEINFRILTSGGRSIGLQINK